jgi:hypothetical protein
MASPRRPSTSSRTTLPVPARATTVSSSSFRIRTPSTTPASASKDVPALKKNAKPLGDPLSEVFDTPEGVIMPIRPPIFDYIGGADGTPGKMHLGLRRTAGNRDSAMGNDIVAHEMTHGVTTRYAVGCGVNFRMYANMMTVA